MNKPRVRWSLLQRMFRTLFRLPPGFVAGRLGAPVERDGRVLDRNVQLLLALGERTGRMQRELEVSSMRAQLRQLAGLGMPQILDVDADDRHIDGPRGPIPIRVFRRSQAPRPSRAIVFLHGGGWVCGDLESHDATCRLLASVAECTVFSVDYRLAPENPFPAAVDDAVAAWEWVHSNVTSLGLDADRIAVMGDSAGGNLAAVLSLVVRDAGLPLPVAQGLIYPAVDMEFTAPSHQSVGVGFGLERRTMDWFRQQYVPDPESWKDPRVSPLHADNHEGLPPALVVTAGFDPLRDEGEAYADKLEQAGVPVRRLSYDDTIHGFFGLGLIPGGLERASEIAAAMGTLLASGSRAAE